MSEHMPMWLQAKADQRAAKIFDAMQLASAEMKTVMAQTIITSFLSEPSKDASPEEFTAWETTCDNCGAQRPPGFACRVITREIEGIKIALTAGACGSCWGAP